MTGSQLLTPNPKLINADYDQINACSEGIGSSPVLCFSFPFSFRISTHVWPQPVGLHTSVMLLVSKQEMELSLGQCMCILTKLKAPNIVFFK